jgi:hypothetical protein
MTHTGFRMNHSPFAAPLKVIDKTPPQAFSEGF